MKRWLPLFLVIVATGSHAADDDWLTRASEAVRTRNYRGVMVYLRDDQMDTLRIVHRYRDGHERERLISLTGEPREIIREDGLVTCALPNNQVVLVSRHRMQGLLSNVAKMSSDKLADNYRIRELGKRRLADRMCRVVRVEPKDEFRYGYRLLVDEKTNLPLKFELLRDNKILEQMMFTDIEFPETIDDAALAATYDTKAFRWVRHQPVEVSAPSGLKGEWEVTQLPPGFRLAEAGLRPTGAGGTVRQLLFTDGVATVSAFIAPLGERNVFTGATTMGAVNAYGRKIDDHQITVVGEVPEVTVRMIAKHVQRRPQSADAK